MKVGAASKNRLVIVYVLLGMAVVGALLALLKGNSPFGWRATVGNLSAPWLVIPYAASVWLSRGSIRRGVAIGVGASWAALLGFYLAVGLTSPYSSNQMHALVESGRYGLRWVLLALLTGPLFGWLGSVRDRTGARRPVLTLVLAVILEGPAHLAFIQIIDPGAEAQPSVWAVEFLVGVVGLAVLWLWSRQRSPVP
jgi:hypothetical protein